MTKRGPRLAVRQFVSPPPKAFVAPSNVSRIPSRLHGGLLSSGERQAGSVSHTPHGSTL